MIGETISHYRIVAKLGGGGMGVVYKAEDLRLGRWSALKFLSEEVEKDPQAVGRFLREARAASALSHPHICTIYEIDEHEGRCFISMELLEGQTLRERIAAGPVKVEQAVEWVIQISDALQAAHRRGIIHRDIKPANVFITDRGEAKILDFGLAKLTRYGTSKGSGEGVSERSTDSSVVSALTTPGMPMGTLAYMSPEQTRGEEVDARSDLFSLGAVLYEMATGRQAFGASTPGLVHDAILNRTPPPAREVNPQIPPALEKAIQKTLEKDRNARYQSAGELHADLRRVERSLDSGDVTWVALDLEGRQRSLRLTPRRTWMVSFGVPVLIAVGVIAILLTLSPRELKERVWGGTGERRIDSLAVLPLENLSRDPDQEYFADGMTEALITDLAKIGGLKVISRTSAMQYKGVKKPLPEIAQELNVEGVVEGSVWRSADRVRITVQLIDAASDRHLWAETYQREVRDLLTLQREVARAVAREVQVRLTPGETRRLDRIAPVSPQAYEAFLKGRYYWNKRTAEGLIKSIEQFEEAIAADPGYALAHAGLADSYIVLGVSDYGVLRPREAMARARAAATDALRLDQSLGEAHASLAIARFAHEWDWAGAEDGFRQAISLNPNYATAHHWYALYLAAMDRPETALAEIERASELDPLSLIISANKGWILYLARQNGQAVEQFHKTLEMDRNYGVARIYLGLAYEQMKQPGDAIGQFQQVIERSGRGTSVVAALGHAYARSGQRARVRELLSELKRRAKKEYVPAHLIARLYAGLGERDESFMWLEKAYEERVGDLVYLKVDPVYDPLRSDPRFQHLVGRMNLPE